MKLPKEKMRLPRELEGVKNGQVPEHLLVDCGLPGFKMTPTAAAAMKALVAAATAAGFKVRATGTYRSLARQEALFRERYTTQELPGRPYKVWNGQRWYHRSGAQAAVPATSNHGIGCAVDFAEELDGDPGVESVSPAFVRWLVANAHRWGVSAELDEEPWHWRYHAGPNVPAEVLAFHETSQPTTPVPPTPAPTPPTLRRGATGGDVRTLQQALTRHGFPAAPDGQFGPKTEAAVRAFQRSRRLTVDGVVGPQTWRALLG